MKQISSDIWTNKNGLIYIQYRYTTDRVTLLLYYTIHWSHQTQFLHTRIFFRYKKNTSSCGTYCFTNSKWFAEKSCSSLKSNSLPFYPTVYNVYRWVWATRLMYKQVQVSHLSKNLICSYLLISYKRNNLRLAIRHSIHGFLVWIGEL